MALNDYLTKHPKKHLIFDLDGTLAVLDVDWSTYCTEMLDLVGSFDKALMESTPFEPSRGIGLVNAAVKKHKEYASLRIREFNKVYEQTHYHGYTPNKPLISFIHQHSNTYLFSLWTSNSTATIQDFLIKERLVNMFAHIVTHDTVSFIKPDPDGFSLIYDGRSPKTDYLMIGDRVFDFEAAQRAGIDFFQENYFINL